jgi:hypothetical protein
MILADRRRENSKQYRTTIDNRGVKTITVGNANGDYLLVCNKKALGCSGEALLRVQQEYEMENAGCKITLACCRIGTVTYTHGENISLFPAEGGSPYELGMYWLQSWTAPDKQSK